MMHNSLNLIEILDNNIYKYEELVNFNKKEFEEYKNLLACFNETNSSKSYSNEAKGEALENLVAFLISKTNIFEIYKNIHTTSNEIDLFVKFNRYGKVLLSYGLVDGLFSNYVCECKNTNNKINVTWIGKFITLTRMGNFNFGLMFSYHGLTGENTWNYAFGLTRKIFLKENTLIIDINYNDLLKISTQKNLLDIINEKVINIKHDIDLTQYLTEHPNTKYIK